VGGIIFPPALIWKGKYMIKIDKQIPLSGKVIFSFDLEWTKNYRIKNGNQPFCFSLVYFAIRDSLSEVENKFDFGYYLRYIESKEEQPRLIKEAEKIISKARNEKGFFVGHQLSSDISVLVNQSRESIIGIRFLQEAWRKRKEGVKFGGLSVFDTRYDIAGVLKNKSRRLVDVCQEFKFNVSQPEIDSSMTKMQNNFYSFGDKSIMERLSVLNLRHSLSAALLFNFFKMGIVPSKIINLNRIVQRNLQGKFEYLQDKQFLDLV
jgi:hypothetical protein